MEGLFVAGCCFIIPAVIITAIFAWAYQLYGHLPYVQPFIYGIKPAIISVIVVTMISLSRKALKSVQLGIIGITSAIAVLAGFNEFMFFLVQASLVVFWYLIQSGRSAAYGFVPFTLLQINNAGLDTSSFNYSSSF